MYVKKTHPMTPWHGNNNDEMPVPKGTLVEVTHRSGSIHYAKAGASFAKDWSIDGAEGDIVAYRVVKEVYELAP